MNELNEYGVFLGDVYCLNYHNILVFFYVSKTTEKTVYLVELGTKKYKGGVTLLKGFKAAPKPLVILENNTYTKTTYEVTPRPDLSLPIQIKMNMPIYKKALEKTEYPLVGTFFITKIKDWANRYWVLEETTNKTTDA